MTFRPGGVGAELYGDPFGGGGPISVRRALAVAGQVVRVVLTGPPTFRTAAGRGDALNPSNYLLEVASGAATAPVPVGVSPVLVVGPAAGVGNGSDAGVADERGVDVHTDRRLIAGITYRVTARPALTAAGGGSVGAPYSATFAGNTRLVVVRPPDRDLDLVDVACPLPTGAWVVDDSGDLAPEDPAVGTRKRIMRRIVTPRGAFAFLPASYGGPLRLKGLASLPLMAVFRDELLAGVRSEPDVADASVSVLVGTDNTVTVSVDARTTRGAFLEVTQQFDASGAPVVPS